MHNYTTITNLRYRVLLSMFYFFNHAILLFSEWGVVVHSLIEFGELERIIESNLIIMFQTVNKN